MLNPLGSRPLVEVPKRPKLSPVAKRRIWEREHGICWWCETPVPEKGPTVEYDHRRPRDLFAQAADIETNIFPMHKRPCHLEKSRGEDWPKITKARRQRKLTQPKVKSKRPLKSRSSFGKGRGFPKGPKRKIKSRGFSAPHRRET